MFQHRSLLGVNRSADPDVILYLYPNGGIEGDHARSVLNLSKNKQYLVESPNDYKSNTPSLSSIANSVGSEETDGAIDIGFSRHLALRFSHGAKTDRGIVAGRDPDADILLSGFRRHKRVDRFHIAFTFNKQNRLIVKDLGSSTCTSVVYDREEIETRRNFEWILPGPDILKDKFPTITIAGLMAFTIVVPPHDITSTEYLDRVARFRKGRNNPPELLAPLNLCNDTDTKYPTTTENPSRENKPIYYKKVLGKGSFGVVTYAWDVSTGYECVWKEPLQRNGYDATSFQNEAELLKRISHDHIVTYQGATFSADRPPRLLFEYLPGGTLGDCQNVSRQENVQVLCQLLSALIYLHGQVPPIAHRDIKPENILVLYRRPRDVHVKFADFGLSKAAPELETFCGSFRWQAPEVHILNGYLESNNNKPYTAAVDIWSLGIVIAEQECGLPLWKPQYGRSGLDWIDDVLAHIKDRRQGNELLNFLLDMMLVKDPQQRKSAAECYERASQLSKLYHPCHDTNGQRSGLVTSGSAGLKANAGTSKPSKHSVIDHNAIDKDGARSDDTTKDTLTASQTPTMNKSIRYGVKDQSSHTRHNPDSNSKLPETPTLSLIANLGERGSSFLNSLLSPSSFESPGNSHIATTPVQPHLGGTPGVAPQARLPAGYQVAQASNAAKAALNSRYSTQVDASFAVTHNNRPHVSRWGETTTGFPATPWTSSGRLKRALPDRSIRAILERDLQDIHYSKSDVSGQRCRSDRELQSYKRPRVSNLTGAPN